MRTNATPEEIVRYSPRYMDVINLKTNKLETVDAVEFLRQVGEQVPMVEQLVSVYSDGHLRQPLVGGMDFEKDDLVVAFEGLLNRTPFAERIHALLNLLERELKHPADIEFASDGKDLYLLQCRAQAPTKHAKPAPIPRDIPNSRLIFSALRSSIRAWSRVFIPTLAPGSMTPGSWWVLASRIRLRTAGVATITSMAATLPVPPTRGTRV